MKDLGQPWMHSNTDLDVTYKMAAVYVPLMLWKVSLHRRSLPHNTFALGDKHELLRIMVN